jgi:hypothetical protein
VDELADAGVIKAKPEALRRRLAEDGYLFFRGLLPAADVRAAQACVLAELRRGGWVTDGEIPADMPSLSPREALSDQAFRAAIASPAFNKIPYLAPLRRLVRLVLGPGAFSYPMKVLRAVYPERPPDMADTRYVHQDYVVSGVQDMLTTWVPLMDIPVPLGGLGVRPGSQLDPPPRCPQVLSEDERGWATTNYRVGDVLVFHCLTSHAALPNRAASLRLSGDFRWQRSDQPAPAQLVLGPGGGQQELFSRRFAREPWWEQVPSATTLRQRESMAVIPPGPSRYFVVHPGWRHWQPARVIRR